MRTHSATCALTDEDVVTIHNWIELMHFLNWRHFFVSAAVKIINNHRLTCSLDSRFVRQNTFDCSCRSRSRRLTLIVCCLARECARRSANSYVRSESVANARHNRNTVEAKRKANGVKIDRFEARVVLCRQHLSRAIHLFSPFRLHARTTTIKQQKHSRFANENTHTDRFKWQT